MLTMVSTRTKQMCEIRHRQSQKGSAQLCGVRRCPATPQTRQRYNLMVGDTSACKQYTLTHKHSIQVEACHPRTSEALSGLQRLPRTYKFAPQHAMDAPNLSSVFLPLIHYTTTSRLDH